MLKLLNISNLAVIDSLRIEFRAGLNVLSGETGSGKSIIIDALGLLLGEKASSDMIRTGSDRAFVEGMFDISDNTPLLELLDEYGLTEAEDDDLVIRRELSTNGRSRIFVNNRTSTIAVLKAIQPHIIDIHGQGDQQSLLSQDAHTRILDEFSDSTALRKSVATVYEKLSSLVKELDESHQSESERLRSLDVIEFQIQEIEQAALKSGEDDELEAERNILAQIEKISTLCDETYGLLYEYEDSILSKLGAVERRLIDLSEIVPEGGGFVDQLESAKHILDDVASSVRDYAYKVVNSKENPRERLLSIEDRLVELDRLKRKYGHSVDDILRELEELQRKRDVLVVSEERSRNLGDSLRNAFDEYNQIAIKLSESRKKGSGKFEESIAAELKDVALGSAVFSVRFNQPSSSTLSEKLENLANIKANGLRRHGKESIEFYFTANPGEELRPISAVASGGELSRLMLVLKTVIAPSQFPKTLIFDEIDSGIGGKTADAVGQRLYRLASVNQILCITHQAQIARYANVHYNVSKEIVDSRTVTNIVELDSEGRIDELARMIGGADSTTSARKHAKELLRTTSTAIS